MNESDEMSDENLSKEAREQAIEQIMDRMTSDSDFAKALRDAVLCTPFSIVTAGNLGRGSMMAPTEAELEEAMVAKNLTREEAYSQLVDQNLQDYDAKLGRFTPYYVHPKRQSLISRILRKDDTH